VPEVLGGRGTLPVAGLGGHEGRPLRKGDLLPVGHAPGCAGDPPPLPRADTPIRIVPGPDLERFSSKALDVLLGSEFRVSPRSDRVGTRLTGPPLERMGDDAGASAPMVRGAIQVPASGEPIVLGPDHPTMGGYPVLATVLSGDVGPLMMRAPGRAVLFALAPMRS
jgi:allophanate hydrolase subunit 2